MDDESVYQKTLDYLYSFVDYSMTRSFRNAPGAFDLGRMEELMGVLGNPERNYPSIHIAGTKGKGSVAALCHAALQAAGYVTGLYTSPHLHDYAERIQVNSATIPHTELVRLVEELKPVFESIPRLTTFEITTALAFVYFDRAGVDAAVVEVGLGGRLDATNVIQPEVSVITSLSYDHTYLLGNTLAEIAAEKAGIVKPGVPVVLAPQEEEAQEVIRQIASQRSARLYEAGIDFGFEPLEHDLDGQKLSFWSRLDQSSSRDNPENLKGDNACTYQIPLLGRHQVENAATACAALQVFRGLSLPVPDEALSEGFRTVKWPGRFEILRRTPPVLVDSAHNLASAERLRSALDDYFPEIPVILVIGASEDKDLAGILAALAPRVREVIATKSFHPRAIEPAEIIAQANSLNLPASAEPDIVDAMDVAIRKAGRKAAVLATGSIFIAAGAREAWQAREGIITA